MAFCAVAILPFGSDNPRALVAADTQCDGPAANTVWLIGTHHKTGTELNNEIMRRLPEGCTGGTCGVVEKCMTTEPECVTAAVTAAGGGGIAFAEHLSIASVGKYADIIAAATEGAGSPLLRVAHWVRDPTEVIMSGFFYHKVTDELWVHANGTLAKKWFDACEAGDDGAAQTACSAAINLEGSVRSGSYQELLNALSDEEGVLVEAWRAGEELAEMNATMHVLGSFPKQSISVDLGEAEVECERVFELVFEARRIAPRTQPAVEKLVPTLFRLSGPRTQPTKAAPTDGAQVLGSSPMGSESECVQLGCSKVAAGKADHRMDPAQESHRIELTKWLEAQGWFARQVQPFRESMQYAARRDDAAISLRGGCAMQYWTQARGWVCGGSPP